MRQSALATSNSSQARQPGRLYSLYASLQLNPPPYPLDCAPRSHHSCRRSLFVFPLCSKIRTYIPYRIRTYNPIGDRNGYLLVLPWAQAIGFARRGVWNSQSLNSSGQSLNGSLISLSLSSLCRMTNPACSSTTPTTCSTAALPITTRAHKPILSSRSEKSKRCREW